MNDQQKFGILNTLLVSKRKTSQTQFVELENEQTQPQTQRANTYLKRKEKPIERHTHEQPQTQKTQYANTEITNHNKLTSPKPQTLHTHTNKKSGVHAFR